MGCNTPEENAADLQREEEEREILKREFQVRLEVDDDALSECECFDNQQDAELWANQQYEKCLADKDRGDIHIEVVEVFAQYYLKAAWK